MIFLLIQNVFFQNIIKILVQFKHSKLFQLKSVSKLN